MTSSIVQPYIDQENANTVTTNHRGQLGSLAGRHAKTFSSSTTPQATPRRALGNLGNDSSKRVFGNIGGKKSFTSQGAPIFKKPSITTPGLQGLTSKKKPLRHKLEGTTKKTATFQSEDVFPNVFKDAFSEIENMHIFDEEKGTLCVLQSDYGVYTQQTPTPKLPLRNVIEQQLLEYGVPRIPDTECLSKFLERLGPIRMPLIHHPKKEDVHPDFSHLQPESNLRSKELTAPDSTLFDLPASLESVTLDSCLLNLPPLESLDFMDLNNFTDF